MDNLFHNSFDENGDYIYSVTQNLITQIVKEQDKHTYEIIDNYIIEQNKNGNIISSVIIPEGKLRHIINLGLSVYNKHIEPEHLFPQEEYIQYLENQIIEYQQENQRLKNTINIMRQTYDGKLSLDTEIE